jgi:hypothetical protein
MRAVAIGRQNESNREVTGASVIDAEERTEASGRPRAVDKKDEWVDGYLEVCLPLITGIMRFRISTVVFTESSRSSLRR